MKHYSRLLFPLVVLLLVAGCSESVSPTGNVGIPLGSIEGEYGFRLNGNGYDSGTPAVNEGQASLRPLAGQGQNAAQLFISLYFEFTDGTYGRVQVSVPLINPQPQTVAISSYTIPATFNATAALGYDSLGFTYYQSLPGGSITITKFDTVNNLVSGTFNYTASQTSPTANPNNVISLTSGYFNDIPISQGSYQQGNIAAVVNDSAFTTNDAGREIILANLDQGRFNVWAYGQGIQNGEISIQSIPLTLGTYIVKGPSNFSDTTSYFIYENRNVEISTQDKGSIGQLTITKCDIPNRRISGTFQFTGTDTLGNRVTITSGEIKNVQWEP